MTFLPIVDRELRVAARRENTYRLRAWAAVLALVAGFFWSFPALLGGASGGAGKVLYTGLTRFVFGLCLLAGVLLTADSLSEEKREGTLGFLFLTDLKGYDVVLGKFMAMSLNAFYGLLAILPVTGLCLLLGGLTGGEFWRTTLALLNTLFFSLAAGICVSAFGREAQRVMGGTLGLVLLCAGGVPAVVNLGRAFRVAPGWEGCEWISPFYPFAQALEPTYSAQRGGYWWALLASQGLGWLMLAIASCALPRHWQDRGAVGEARRLPNRRTRQGGGRATAKGAGREKLLRINPVLWLMGRESRVRRMAWVIVCAWGAVVLLMTLVAPRQDSAFILGVYGVRPFGFLLKILFALQACQFFVEARRSGALEMLLCTPLTSRDIINGQVLALRRNFQWPVITMLLVLFVPSVVQLFVAGALDPRGAGATFMAGFTCLSMIADCYALGAFGMWLALTLKKPGLAPALTILFVLVLPSALCVLDIVADLFFIFWGMMKLRWVDLRWLLAREYQRRTAATIPAPAVAR